MLLHSSYAAIIAVTLLIKNVKFSLQIKCLESTDSFIFSYFLALKQQLELDVEKKLIFKNIQFIREMEISNKRISGKS